VSPLLALRNLSSAAEPELAGWLSLSECRTLSRDGPESLFSPVPLVVVAIVLLEWSTALLSAGRLGVVLLSLSFPLGWADALAAVTTISKPANNECETIMMRPPSPCLASNAVGAIMHCSIT
jgi:hypothetical protein